MPKPIQLHDIIVANPPRSPREDWARQRRSAIAVAKCFAQGRDTILLADEVGMGKTYVALAEMAGYLFQSDTNDRKVLLVTPPSSVLRVKWQQEILSFNENYLTPATRARKGMQPIPINSYWDLLRNLKDFRNQKVLRVDEETRSCFIWCMFNWAFSRKLLGKKRRSPWVSIAGLHVHDLRIANFLAQYSEHAIWRFLDANYRLSAHFYQDMFRSLQDGSFNGPSRFWRSEVARLFKQFADEQDKYEPNVYIIGMNALMRPRIDHADNKFLSKYLLVHLLFRRRTATWKAHAETLVRANILTDEYVEKHAHRWRYYVKSMDDLARSEFYGLRLAVIDAIQTPVIQETWRLLSEDIMRGNVNVPDARAFFNQLGNLVFATQLARANIGLAVVDEVHNWKGGAYGAQAFRDFYAPAIRHKLMLSATPFQMDEGEMARLFDFVQARGGKSEATMQALYSPDGEIANCLVASDAFRIAWQALSTMPAEAARMQDIFNVADVVALDATANRYAEDYAEPEEIRQFAASLITYRRAIRKLEKRLGQVVIRHTKSRAKRNFHIGEDFDRPTGDSPRNALYPAIGYASEEDALVNFIGMRLGQLVQREEKKSFEANARLLGGMTSSTAAFRVSARRIGKTPATLAYRTMFERILDTRMHPKVAATVERAFRNFEAGRKTLIFCERIATLKEIEQELNKRIDGFISAQGSSSAIERSKLLKRRDLLENLWWHSLWEAIDQRATGADLLNRYLPDAQAFAQRCLEKVNVHPSARRIINLLDVSLISRAFEDGHLAQTAWQPTLAFFSSTAKLLDKESCQDSFPNLRDFLAPSHSDQNGGDDVGEDGAQADDEARGLKGIPAAIEAVARLQYRERRSLWLMEGGQDFHALLWRLLASETAQLRQQPGDNVPADLEAQVAMVFFDVLDDLMTGIRKITLRDDLLVRYERASQATSAFARIAEGVHSMRIGHDSSMLARVTRFLTSLVEAEGSISRSGLEQSKRKSLWQGVSIGRVGSVATLDGSTPAMNRAGMCAAFNSPLLPDILICTSIGSEGIDLHRQCSDIIHHDLPWNPAKLEQRNGRVDRVGSLAAMSDDLLINIGIPFLAHNYEQHQYRKVYSRAQKFEVLLGRPEFDAIDIEEEDYSDENGEKTLEAQIEAGDNDAALHPLPQAVVDALRLDLSVRIDGATASCSVPEQKH